MRIALLLALCAAVNAPAAVRVLVLSGQNNHDWRTTTPYLRKILTSAGDRFDVRVSEEPSALDARALENYDALVVDYQGPRWRPETERAVESFVKGGRGLVAYHAAGYAFCGNEILGDRHVRTGKTEPAWPEWRRLIGGCWAETGDKATKTAHGARHLFQVKATAAEHPILRNVALPFTISDELYHRMRLDPQANVIAKAFSATEMGGTGQDEPMMWTVNYGKGRVFFTTLGHDTSAMASPGFATTFARAVEWTATGEVTIAAKLLPDAYKANAVKALVITGGHDHQPSFYTLFEGDGDIDAMTDSHPAALHKDLSKYAVLVFHDMYKGLDEKGRANLRAYVESGHGIVVTHHALATFTDWEWWWKDVVGATYNADSTYAHDQVIDVRLAAKHPILNGVPPMELMDETYKGQWFGPGLIPLLETDHPKSDRLVAWVSPYKNSRVIVIQLGHDRWSHLHPGYRQLVHNAIMWAAQR
jgi:type 1 glutamine amidotransferase